MKNGLLELSFVVIIELYKHIMENEKWFFGYHCIIVVHDNTLFH